MRSREFRPGPVDRSKKAEGTRGRSASTDAKYRSASRSGPEVRRIETKPDTPHKKAVARDTANAPKPTTGASERSSSPSSGSGSKGSTAGAGGSGSGTKGMG